MFLRESADNRCFTGGSSGASARPYLTIAGGLGAARKGAHYHPCITIHFDPDILNWFREKLNERGGGNYQTMMNDALRSCIHYQDKMLEETIRKVIKEELRSQG